jgi:uncharacterized protein YndB with AHSA1/START domain
MGTAVIFTVLCLIGPKNMDVSVTKTIQAPADIIYNQFADFRNWPNWSAWHKKDSQMVLMYGATTSGIGGNYSWTSPNKNTGTGSMEITALDTNARLKMKLEFKDWDAVSDCETTFKPNENHALTDVTWSMKDRKQLPFYLRGIMLFMNPTETLKKDFNDGLTNIENYIKATPSLYNTPVK